MPCIFTEALHWEKTIDWTQWSGRTCTHLVNTFLFSTIFNIKLLKLSFKCSFHFPWSCRLFCFHTDCFYSQTETFQIHLWGDGNVGSTLNWFFFWVRLAQLKPKPESHAPLQCWLVQVREVFGLFRAVMGCRQKHLHLQVCLAISFRLVRPP